MNLENLYKILEVLANGVARDPVVAGATLVLLAIILAVVYLAIKTTPLPRALWALLATGFLAVVFALSFAVLVRDGDRDLRRKTTSLLQFLSHTPEDIQKEVTRLLVDYRKAVSKELDLDPERVRANIFAPDEGGLLKIVPRFVSNMSLQRELLLQIEPGYGCTGRAIDLKQWQVCIKDAEKGWGEATLKQSTMVDIHQDLRWIVSTPVVGVKGQVWVVLNVDGLVEKEGKAPTRESLEKLADSASKKYAAELGKILAKDKVGQLFE